MDFESFFHREPHTDWYDARTGHVDAACSVNDYGDCRITSYDDDGDPLGIAWMTYWVSARGDGVTLDKMDWSEALLPFGHDVIRALTSRVIGNHAEDFHDLVFAHRDYYMAKQRTYANLDGSAASTVYPMENKFIFTLLDVGTVYGVDAMYRLMDNLKFLVNHLDGGMLTQLAYPLTVGGFTDEELVALSGTPKWALSRYNSWFVHIPSVNVDTYPKFLEWTVRNSNVEDVGDGLKNRMEYRKYGLRKKTLLDFIVDAENRGPEYGSKAYGIVSAVWDGDEQDIAPDMFTMDWLESVLAVPVDVALEEVSMDVDDSVHDLQERYDRATMRIHRIAPVLNKYVIRPLMNQAMGYCTVESVTNKQRIDCVRTCEMLADALYEWTGAEDVYATGEADIQTVWDGEYTNDYPEYDLPLMDMEGYTHENGPVDNGYGTLSRFLDNEQKPMKAGYGTEIALFSDMRSILQSASRNETAYHRFLLTLTFMFNMLNDGVDITYHADSSDKREAFEQQCNHDPRVMETIELARDDYEDKITRRNNGTPDPIIIMDKRMTLKRVYDYMDGRPVQSALSDYHAVVNIGPINTLRMHDKTRGHIMNFAEAFNMLREKYVREYITKAPRTRNRKATKKDYEESFLNAIVIPYIAQHPSSWTKTLDPRNITVRIDNDASSITGYPDDEEYGAPIATIPYSASSHRWK